MFFGVTAMLTLDLLLRPPESSYWKRYNILKWPEHMFHFFKSIPSSSVFFNKEFQGSSKGFEAYETLIKS
jgi:hypothetical protein